MPTWEDVVETGTRLPGVEVSTRNKLVGRLRTNPAALVLRLSDTGEREALLQGQPDAFFTTPHYDGYP